MKLADIERLGYAEIERRYAEITELVMGISRREVAGRYLLHLVNLKKVGGTGVIDQLKKELEKYQRECDSKANEILKYDTELKARIEKLVAAENQVKDLKAAAAQSTARIKELEKQLAAAGA